jgi:CubicO group peptidase (beta-lactamase class C family)
VLVKRSCRKVAVPYEFNKSTGTYEKRDWPTLGNYEVGGGIRSTVGDLLKYGEQFVCEYPIVSKDQLQSMWQPYVRVYEDTFYGYALTTTPDVNKLTLVEHGGGQPGVSSYFCAFIIKTRANGLGPCCLDSGCSGG